MTKRNKHPDATSPNDMELQKSLKRSALLIGYVRSATANTLRRDFNLLKAKLRNIEDCEEEDPGKYTKS